MNQKKNFLTLGIIEMRERYKSQSREIIVPFELDLELNNIVFTVPQRGDKKKLLDLSVLNVKQYKADRLKTDRKAESGTKEYAFNERNSARVAFGKTAATNRVF